MVAKSGVSPLEALTQQEGTTLELGRFDQIGMAALASAAALNAVEIADGEPSDSTTIMFSVL